MCCHCAKLSGAGCPRRANPAQGPSRIRGPLGRHLSTMSLLTIRYKEKSSGAGPHRWGQRHYSAKLTPSYLKNQVVGYFENLFSGIDVKC